MNNKSADNGKCIFLKKKKKNWGKIGEIREKTCSALNVLQTYLLPKVDERWLNTVLNNRRFTSQL